MKIQPRTLKGFRDFLPKEMRKRQYVIDTLRGVFESYGFEPLETPALEYSEILTGKYGDEGDKLMYRFEDKGGRDVALRYDQTVPLARVVAEYKNDIPLPFKRYQIQNVWRAENTQKGRFREFLQCDIDTVGTDSLLADAEVIACAITAVSKLGLKGITLYINDRKVFYEVDPTYIASIDKLEKIGRDRVIAELVKKGLNNDDAQDLLSKIEKFQITENLKLLLKTLESLEVKNTVKFKPTLARGLNYYTGTIFELSVQSESNSIGGGGRYDNLIGIFGKDQIPAVGFSFGIDRLIDAMEELGLFPDDLQTTKVLVTISSDSTSQSNIVVNKLRDENINTELYLDKNITLDKQFKYAEKKGIPVIIVPVDDDKYEIRSKNKKTGEITKKVVTLDSLSSEISQNPN